MKRLVLALALSAGALLLPLGVLADGEPYETVVDSMVPTIKGLSIQGGSGGCDLIVQNLTPQDVVLFDMSKPPKPFRFAAQPKGASPKPAADTHLTGAWPCANLPAVTEDERWNHTQVTVGQWSIIGAAGAVSFKLNARSVYDPALDPSADLTFYLRVGAGLLAVGALVLTAPYLFRKRRALLARKKAA